MDSNQVLRVVIANAKGGSGKTTMATNLVSAYCAKGVSTALFDFDLQGSSMAWLGLRSSDLPEIHGVPAYRMEHGGATRSWALRVPPEVQRVVVDTPAGLSGAALRDQLKGAQVVLVPVLPCSIDMLAAAEFIKELQTYMRTSGQALRIGLIANRVKKNTKVLTALHQFLAEFNVPVVAQVRDVQSYVACAEQGVGVAELKAPRIKEEHKVWRQIYEWVETGQLDEQPADVSSGVLSKLTSFGFK